MNSRMNRPAWTVEELKVLLGRYAAELSSASNPPNHVTAFIDPVHQFLEWVDGPYRPIRGAAGPIAGRDGGRIRAGRGPLPATMSLSVPIPQDSRDQVSEAGRRSSYDALRAHLSERTDEPRVTLSFSEIARILGRKELPHSARHRAWWSNDRSGSHVHARSWMNADPPRRTEKVDFDAKTVDFVIEEESE